MSTNVKALREEDLLLPFEKHALRDPFRLYICVKRNNRFATMQAFPQMWSAIQLVDSIWERELRDLYTLIDPTDPLPLSLFIGAFARTRESLQLGLSGCINEAADLMRGAVEYGIQGLRIKEDPALANIWIRKDKGKDEYKAFSRAFEKEKKERLFKGQNELHRYWTKFSDWGSHSTIAALALRLRFTETESLKASFEFFRDRSDAVG